MLRLLLVFVACLPVYTQALQLTLSGQFKQPGTLAVADGSRINTVLEQVAVDEQAFFIGASWHRLSARPAQQQLKKGILFDLHLLQQQATLANRQDVANMAVQLQQQLAPMPVTGRIKHVMDPAALLATDINHLLEDGDLLHYPARPSNVLLMGATATPCRVAFSSLQTAAYYLAQCAKTALADRNFITIIQPDGNIIHEGIALWNRDQPGFIAPGAIIFVPVSATLLDDMISTLNQDIATFLATQAPVMDIAP